MKSKRFSTIVFTGKFYRKTTKMHPSVHFPVSCQNIVLKKG